MLRLFRWVILSLMICSSSVALTGCDQDGPLEDTAEDVEEAGDELD